MTEAQWLKCTDLAVMFESKPLWGKITLRKYRLFAIACCRRIWQLFRHEALREAVEISERYADGQATDSELSGAVTWFNERAETEARYATQAEEWASSAAFVCITQHDYRLAGEAAYHCASARGNDTTSGQRRIANENQKQCDLLRDLFGYPFRSVSIKSSWQTPTVVAIAKAAYDDRALPAGILDPNRLAVLADALEDAGCTETVILEHLRGAGPHVRGCFALDLILGKE